ncbi:Protein STRICTOSIDINE SYNTHASE-LIKE 10 [Abeliophyllum distichum]|uniref:Protein STRICTOSIDINE SYNTHASE-LIKE 10 n=1 Tax=Abeliophyllum distichum TaxID=126358 RepID=A0ABD1PPU7_9LAMI
MNSNFILTTIALAVLSAAIAFHYRETATSVFTPPTIPGSDDLLHLSERIQLSGAVGPESLAFDSNGEGPYTGVADGRILKWKSGDDSNGWVEFAVTSSQR